MADRRQAAQELLRRQQIRGSMSAWAEACDYRPAPHHLFIIRHLEKIASGELRRLLIAALPGSAKSTYASVLFPAWYLAQHPEHHMILAAHTVELAERFARRARNLIMEHSTALGLELADDSQSAGRWSLKSGGSVFAVGAGGAVVGQRADAILIDDPLRGREEAKAQERNYSSGISATSSHDCAPAEKFASFPQGGMRTTSPAALRAPAAMSSSTSRQWLKTRTTP
jgi:hypothetical protein